MQIKQWCSCSSRSTDSMKQLQSCRWQFQPRSWSLLDQRGVSSLGTLGAWFLQNLILFFLNWLGLKVALDFVECYVETPLHRLSIWHKLVPSRAEMKAGSLSIIYSTMHLEWDFDLVLLKLVNYRRVTNRVYADITHLRYLGSRWMLITSSAGLFVSDETNLFDNCWRLV